MGGCLKTLGVLLLLAVVVIVIASMTGPSQSDKERSLVIAKVVLANLTYRPEWESISISTAEPTNYDFTLWYREDAVVYPGQPEADTEVIVRAMLSQPHRQRPATVEQEDLRQRRRREACARRNGQAARCHVWLCLLRLR